MASLFRSVFKSSQDGQARTDQSSTRAYEDQSILADAGYQPKMDRSSSLPPSSSHTSCKYQDEEPAKGPARKRTSSTFPDGRPPRAPPLSPKDFHHLTPLTPELVGTNVSFPGSASTFHSSRSPADAAHQESTGPVFFDIA